MLQAMALLKQSPNQNRLNLQGPLVNLRADSEIQSFFAPDGEGLRLAFSGSYEIPQFLEGFNQSIHYSVDLDLRHGSVNSKWGGVSFTYQAQKKKGCCIPNNSPNFFQPSAGRPRDDERVRVRPQKCPFF